MNHELKYPREYSDEIRKFEVTDRGHADIFNAPVNDLINNDAYMKEHMDVVENTLAGHTENGDIHVTAAQKSAWTNKAEKTVATTASAGLMGAADKSKLDGITAGAEVNQNAISTLVAGSTNVTANSKTAAVTLTAGTNITITGDNATKKVTISAPTAVKNPQPIAIQLNGTTAASYDGSAAKTVNITPAGIGAPGTATFKALEDKVTQLNSDLTDCLKSVSEGKKKLASTFTAKGVTMASDATFDTLNTGLGSLENAAYNKGITATKKGTATAGQVLTGYSFTNSSGVGLSGSMPNRGALNWNPGEAASYNVPAGYYSGGTLISTTAYNKGVADADNRPNGNSVNYVSGYNAGVAAADNRANPNSVNYQSGYNNGVAAGRANITTRYYHNATDAGASHTHDFQVYVPAGYNYLTFSFDVFAGYNNVAPISVLRDGSGALYSTSITTRGSGNNIRIGVSGATYIMIRVTIMHGASTVDMTAVLSAS